MNTIKWCPHHKDCRGNCPKKKCYVCPWETWEHGPDEDFFPTQQECAEDRSLRAYIDPRKYVVRAVYNNDRVAKDEIKRIHDAMNRANDRIQNDFGLIRIEIERLGEDMIIASSEA